MTDSRLGRVWGLVAGQAAQRGGQVSAGDACAAAVAAAAVSGAWLIAARGTGAAHLMQATDEVSELLAELELTLGEGPGRDAAEASGPVLASDLGDAGAARRWPLFAAAACEAGAAAVFAFPLQVGAIRAGVMGLYRARPELSVGIAAAFIRLRAYAYVNGLRLTDVARDIVARRLRLQPDPDPAEQGDG